MSQAEKIAEVSWEDPPRGRGRYDWYQISEQLRARPGEWAKVFEFDRTSIVNAIRQGAVRSLAPELGFELKTRNNVRGPIRMCSLFMRWVDPSGKADD